MTRTLKGLMALALVGTVAAGCGGSAQTVGPNVVGMGLPLAEQKLTAAGISFSSHPMDGMMGILVKDNWVVCEQVPIDSTTVRLEVAKYGC